jgi:hypothetical protein
MNAEIAAAGTLLYGTRHSDSRTASIGRPPAAMAIDLVKFLIYFMGHEEAEPA